jgi:hypothetical protein
MVVPQFSLRSEHLQGTVYYVFKFIFRRCAKLLLPIEKLEAGSLVVALGCNQTSLGRSEFTFFNVIGARDSSDCTFANQVWARLLRHDFDKEYGGDPGLVDPSPSEFLAAIAQEASVAPKAL